MIAPTVPALGWVQMFLLRSLVEDQKEPLTPEVMLSILKLDGTELASIMVPRTAIAWYCLEHNAYQQRGL